VEGALVIVPLMAILFALMDFAVAIFVQNVLRHAVRESVRFAVTQQTGAGGQDAAIKTVAQNESMGFLSDVSTVSITYYDKTLTQVTGVGSNGQGNICVVAITGYPWSWFAPVLRANTALAFNVTSSDVMEAPPNGVLPGR
jgi:Flp pilus assembly protein TadG